MWIIVFSSLLVLRLLKNTARVQYSPFDVLRETQVDEESTTQLACFTAMVTFPSFLRYGKGVEEPAGGGDSACEEDLPLDAAWGIVKNQAVVPSPRQRRQNLNADVKFSQRVNEWMNAALVNIFITSKWVDAFTIGHKVWLEFPVLG